ncbi:MAG: LysM peptidoglycan-binding domain-containing protein [Lachnospiraceae bacterium]|nr:LysM peptidoglycan-binding domain-containing protein [Lachnospiraceae bacterium]
MTVYVVQPGDTVDSIAAAQGVSISSIIYNNQLSYPYPLAVGQALLLTLPEPSYGREIRSGGYAYPFINRWVLEQSLPYLSDLYIFSYGFTTEGELVPPWADDSDLISAAKTFGTAPILTLTPFGPDGRFSNYLITTVINNPAAVENLIANLEATILEKGFEGVDIDFEFILAQDRLPFVSFVRRVREAVNALGYPVSVALAPKTSDDQKGLLYEGKDYAQLGEAADYVLLMTYEWGYKYGPPLAVAPINQVRRVVEYALTRIPPEKIHLGIPNYGYDWTLPFEQGTSEARTLGNIEARQLAINYGVNIQFDEVAASPFFRYESEGATHEVWFEDVRSMEAKFALVNEYNLRGIGIWQIMELFRGMYLLLADRFTISK